MLHIIHHHGMLIIQKRKSENASQVSYTRGLDLSGNLQGAGGIGGVLARSHGYSSGTFSTDVYYHADGNRNVTYLVTAGEALAASYKYDPFGNLVGSSGNVETANLYRFSSKMPFVNVPMYYYGYRWYDVGNQRWLNRDPIHEKGGRNLYVFVHNRPPNVIDALGLTGLGHGIGVPLLRACQAIKDISCNSTAGYSVVLQLEAAGIEGDAEGGGNAFIEDRII